MVLTNSGAVSFTNIKTEFGGGATVKISDYRTGAGYITNSAGMFNVPSSGTISMTNLRGRWKNAPPSRYPPTGLTANTSTVSGQSYGNGQYICSATYLYDSQNQPYKMFDYSEGAWNSGWSCVGRYSDATGAYTGANSFVVGGVTYSGERFDVQMPSAVKICKWAFVCRNDWLPWGYTNRLPYQYSVFGSSNGSTWNLISTTTQTYSSQTPAEVEIYTNNVAYAYWRLVVQSCGNPGEPYRGGADIAEWRCWFTTT